MSIAHVSPMSADSEESCPSLAMFVDSPVPLDPTGRDFTLKDLLQLTPSIDQCVQCQKSDPELLFPCLFHGICQLCADKEHKAASSHCAECFKCNFNFCTLSTGGGSGGAAEEVIPPLQWVRNVFRVSASVCDPAPTAVEESSGQASPAIGGSPPDAEYLCAWCMEAGERNGASLHCEQCDQHFCHECNQGHQRLPMSRSHRVTALKAVPSLVKPRTATTSAAAAGHANADQHNYCPVHSGELLNIYCDTCAVITCRNCQLSGGHGGHKHQWFEDKCRSLAGDLQRELQPKLVEFRDKMDEKTLQLQKEMHQLASGSQTALHELLKHKSVVLQSVEESFNRKIVYLNDGVECIDKLLREKQIQMEHYLRIIQHLKRLFVCVCEPLLGEDCAASRRDLGLLLLQLASPMTRLTNTIIRLICRQNVLSCPPHRGENGCKTSEGDLAPVYYVPSSSLHPDKVCNSFGQILFLSPHAQPMTSDEDKPLINNGGNDFVPVVPLKKRRLDANFINSDTSTAIGCAESLASLSALSLAQLSRRTQGCCLVCGEAKNMIACKLCYQLYHAGCHVPRVRTATVPSRDWRCAICSLNQCSGEEITDHDRLAFVVMKLLTHPLNYLLRSVDAPESSSTSVESFHSIVQTLPPKVKLALLNSVKAAKSSCSHALEDLMYQLRNYLEGTCVDMDLTLWKQDLSDLISERLMWFKGQPELEKALLQFSQLLD